MSWLECCLSVSAFVCLDVNQGRTNCNRCTRRLVISVGNNVFVRNSCMISVVACSCYINRFCAVTSRWLSQFSPILGVVIVLRP